MIDDTQKKALGAPYLFFFLTLASIISHTELLFDFLSASYGDHEFE